jgi:hypothetical protein
MRLGQPILSQAQPEGAEDQEMQPELGVPHPAIAGGICDYPLTGCC